MTKKSKIRVPKRSSLFYKYFRVTFSILIVTAIAFCAIFVMFMIDYWTSTTVENVQRNVKNLANAIELIERQGLFDSDAKEAQSTLLVDFHSVSDALGADFFMTDAKGNVIICKDMLDDNLNVVHDDADFCSIHGPLTVEAKILQNTTADGYYTLSPMKGLDDEICIVVGQKVIGQDGSSKGYVFATLPVSDNLNKYVLNMLRLFAAAALITLVFAVALVYLFSNRMTKPLREMSRITKLYARGDFTQRIEIKGNDELTDLADKLNNMADSLAVIDKSRSSFVANVSHELKTPMTSIGGFIDGILDGTIPENEEKRYLKIVSDEIKRLSNLVQTMLMLSKIEAGGEHLKPETTELKNLLFSALLEFEKSIEESNIEISGFENMEQIKVVADEKMLFQVLYNLFDNAVKFTNEGGTIFVELVEESDKVTVSIANTGEGIKEEELIHIFERFYKVDKSRSEHVKGVGLGLNLAKNIVKLHGGEISVSSTPGELTNFSFWIPKNQ